MSTSQDAVARACEALGGRVGLAAHLEVTPAAVSQWCSGERRVPAERCLQIERATLGRVRCEELRPDIDWSRVSGAWDGTERRQHPD